MKRHHLIVGLVVVAAAALALYVMRGDGGGENEEAAGDPDELPATPVRQTADESRRGRDDPGQAAVLVDDDPEGNLRLEGQVIDANNIPVGGATVIVSSVPPREVVTEEDGSFYFDKLVGRPYRLIARHELGVAGPVTARLTESNDPVILQLAPGGKVAVTVVDGATQDPIDGATVELRGMNVQTGMTGAEGVATIAPVVPDRYRVAAHAPGYATQHGWARVRGETTEEVTLALRRGAPVSGRVVTPDGKPVAGARVLYSGASEWGQQADPRLDAALTDAKGAWRFPALAAGTFRFVARHPDYAPGRSELVTLDGTTERTGVEVVVDPGATLLGKVVSVDKEPVPAARVRVSVQVAGMRWGRPRQAYADDDGAFSMSGLPQKELEVVAMHQSGSSQILDVDMTGATEQEVEIVLDVTETIEGIVINTSGDPVEGAQVSAFPDFEKGATVEPGEWRLRGWPTEMTGADGTFVLGGLKPGVYRVTASPSNASRRRGAMWRTGESVKAGTKGVELVLQEDGGVKGVVEFADGDPPKMFTVGFGFRGSTPFSTKDGSFELDDLPPNTYSITIRGPGFDARTVSNVKVEPGELTDIGTIVVSKGRTISGRVLANGQGVEGATVYAGRMLFGTGSSTGGAPGGGPPGAQNVKETTTDADGYYSVSGLGPAQVSVVAEHESIGRSKTSLVPRTSESSYDLDLVLQPYGALEGIVRKGGKPAESVRIGAQSQVAPGAIFGVASGPDGKFRLDKLAPDDYRVSAVLGNPFQGMGFHAKTVTVLSDQTAFVELEIEVGSVTLDVQPVAEGGGELNFAMVYLIEGAVDAQVSSELQLKMGATDAFSTFGMAFMGRSASIDELMPGAYTVCIEPYPNELDMQAFQEYNERMGDLMPVHCQPVEVTPEPAMQKLEVAVPVPDYVPPPGEGEGEGEGS